MKTRAQLIAKIEMNDKLGAVRSQLRKTIIKLGYSTNSFLIEKCPEDSCVYVSSNLTNEDTGFAQIEAVLNAAPFSTKRVILKNALTGHPYTAYIIPVSTSKSFLSDSLDEIASAMSSRLHNPDRW